MKIINYLIMILSLISFLGCIPKIEYLCPSKFMICDSKGIRCRCGSKNEKKELTENPETNKYIYQY